MLNWTNWWTKLDSQEPLSSWPGNCGFIGTRGFSKTGAAVSLHGNQYTTKFLESLQKHFPCQIETTLLDIFRDFRKRRARSWRREGKRSPNLVGTTRRIGWLPGNICKLISSSPVNKHVPIFKASSRRVIANETGNFSRAKDAAAKFENKKKPERTTRSCRTQNDDEKLPEDKRRRGKTRKINIVNSQTAEEII